MVWLVAAHAVLDYADCNTITYSFHLSTLFEFWTFFTLYDINSVNFIGDQTLIQQVTNVTNLLEPFIFPCLVLAIAARLAWVALSGNRDLFIPPPFTWITTSKKKMHLQPFALLLLLFTTLSLLIHNEFKPFLKKNYLHFYSLECMNLSYEAII